MLAFNIHYSCYKVGMVVGMSLLKYIITSLKKYPEVIFCIN